MVTELSRIQLERAARELWWWRTSDSNCFLCQLFNLLGHADIKNQAALERGFPAEVQVWREWKRAPNEETFLRRWRLGKFAE